ncbi:MAG: lipopolysaccharide kinase InaA family protein [Methylotenera sp.]|nr:lipopolysaccharide kinase InaA family protein [Methylotenera sp.]
MTPISANQPSMLTGTIIRKGLAYIFSGRFYIRHGHLPPANHHIPENFIGICVASSKDASMDDYVITQLRELNIKEVRLDFTYGDLEHFNARFLTQLISEKFNVTLHIVQPFNAARNMENVDEQNRWQAFIEATLTRFGADISRIEIGATINRKRWAGYTMQGFLRAWEIAFIAAKQRNILLAGPNVTDFEPIYNIGVLSMLQAKKQLPDVHTNNLFSERVSEPERFDHRVFKYRWATILKFNLIKKARLLKKIGTDFGVNHFISPVAFWAIYRIERLLKDGEQKQADYTARYMILTAASGVLDQVFWGALICHREGLIDDGLSDAEYPALERVSHYANVDGQLQNFRRHASFKAFKTVASLLQGSQYINALATTNGLEIHHFQTAMHEVHALWTINGKIAFLSDFYDASTLLQADIIDRDGNKFDVTVNHISESPIYICWPKGYSINSKSLLALAKDLAIHAHIKNMQYYPFLQDGWFGLVLAKSVEEALIISKELHPDSLTSPQKNVSLRHARNAIWALPDPRNPENQVTVKQPVKMYPHKALLDRFKPSKAKRSWNGAVELLRRGVNTAHPVAFFEKENDTTLKQNFYICDYVKADCSVGEMFIHFSKGNKEFYFVDKNCLISAEETYEQLARFLFHMHQSGSYFRDLSGGNVLVQLQEKKQLHFSLIDTARARFHTYPSPFNERYSDLARICNKLDWVNREIFIGLYLKNTGREFNFEVKLKFYLYDFKVAFKRKFGRKGIKNLVRKFKN